MSIITLTTDFGTGSPYVAAMKGVILSINPAVTLVDVTHDVPAQDIRQGAIVLRDVAGRFPPETIHAAVVDPGVGTDRAIVCARIAGQIFVAPDNGLLGLVAARTAPEKIVRLAEPEFWLPEVSTTFHGRDVMAPVAARLSLGLDPDRLGPALESLVALDFPKPELGSGEIAGEVIQVDSFGNLVTNITAAMLSDLPDGSRIRVACGGREIAGLALTYGDLPASSLISLIGSSDRLEVSVVGGSASDKLNVGTGDKVNVSWGRS